MKSNQLSAIISTDEQSGSPRTGTARYTDPGEIGFSSIQIERAPRVHSLAVLFKAFSDESRLRIYCLLLAAGEVCVCDIEATLGFTQTKVSRHLSYLKRVELVKSRKHGLWMYYSLVDPRNADQRSILAKLSEHLKSDATTQRDVKRLEKQLGKTC